MEILGIHHITLICTNAQATLNFYTRLLGLRLVKKTVDLNDPQRYHLFFGDETGRPGTLVTAIEYPAAQRGYPGIGGTHHFAFIAETADAQLKWKRRLQDYGLSVVGPYPRVYFTSIYFRDPDGAILEIATRGPGFTADEPPETLGQALRPPPLEYRDGHRDEAAIAARTWPEPVPALTADMRLAGLHHITAIGSDIERTTDFYAGLLGVPLVKRTMNFDDPTSPHYYYALRLGEPGTVITYFERPAARELPARLGAGQTHHFALAAPEEAALHEWRQRLLSAGCAAGDVRDHLYFKSIQFHDPFGHILELAAEAPGLTADEDLAELGTGLQLPPWLEPERERIESGLAPLGVESGYP